MTHAPHWTHASRSGHFRSAFLALACASLVACGGGGGGGKPKPTPSGVTVLSATSCPSGPGALPGSTCQRLEIAAGNNATMRAEVRVYEPDPHAGYLGTVVLSSGGNGTEFYSNLLGGDQLIVDLVAQGLRVVDRRWESAWLQAGTDLLESSRGYPVLIDWVRDNIHAGGLLAVTGNSGGSSEIAYGLTSWDLDDLVDVAVLTNGPGMARLDYSCFAPTAAWSALCPSIVPAGALTCGTPLCTAPAETNLCKVHATGKTALEMQLSSVLHPGAELDQPSTLIHVLVGEEDCGLSTVQAVHFQQSLLGPSTLNFIDSTGHDMSGTPEGRLAILTAILGYAPLEAAAPPAVHLQLTVIQGEREATLTETWR